MEELSTKKENENIEDLEAELARKRLELQKEKVAAKSKKREAEKAYAKAKKDHENLLAVIKAHNLQRQIHIKSPKESGAAYLHELQGTQANIVRLKDYGKRDDESLEEDRGLIEQYLQICRNRMYEIKKASKMLKDLQKDPAMCDLAREHRIDLNFQDDVVKESNLKFKQMLKDYEAEQRKYDDF